MSGGDRGLDEADLSPDPFEQWRRWFAEAADAGVAEPEAMSLATVGEHGRPEVRFVLCKGVDDRGWRFYTNEGSAKGRALAARPVAALAWRWAPLDRQVRVAGRVERVDAAVADRYFASRPRASQLGAWASEQSSVIPDRAVLERRVDEAAARFAGGEVTRPPYWGGYRVRPDEVEFWQGRTGRLHDRLRYRPAGTGWRVERLSP